MLESRLESVIIGLIMARYWSPDRLGSTDSEEEDPRTSNRSWRDELVVSDTDEEVDDLAEETRFYRRFELFVGNISHCNTERTVLNFLNATLRTELELTEGRMVSIVDFITPARGQPFCFVRCSSQRVFDHLLTTNVSFDGRRWRIARSRRVTGQSDSEGSDLENDSGTSEVAVEAATATNDKTAYAILRESARKEIKALENEFQEQFNATASIIEDLKRKRDEKKTEKLRIKGQIKALESSLTRCETEENMLSSTIGQVSHRYLFYENWPQGGFVKRICLF